MRAFVVIAGKVTVGTAEGSGPMINVDIPVGVRYEVDTTTLDAEAVDHAINRAVEQLARDVRLGLKSVGGRFR
jgi:hypothetical protein